MKACALVYGRGPPAEWDILAAKLLRLVWCLIRSAAKWTFMALLDTPFPLRQMSAHDIDLLGCKSHSNAIKPPVG